MHNDRASIIFPQRPTTTNSAGNWGTGRHISETTQLRIEKTDSESNTNKTVTRSAFYQRMKLEL